MKKKLHDNGLTVVLVVLFLLSFIGQIFTGWHEYNSDQQEHNNPTVALGGYLTTGHFVEATFENWESEFLQMAAYVLLAVWLYQRGSAESKDPDKEEPVDADPDESRDDPNAPGPVRAGGWKLKLYECSLSMAFGVLFIASFLLHAAGGAAEYSSEQRDHGEAAVTMWEYLQTSRFWFESFQNWQSEFLSVIAIVVFSIYLRQKGSPESKPVAAPHSQTGNG
ncbi:MAG TPA: DUF6766 family protein [Abditibacteriaceae bacterium]|jgi:hypothetical protein